jgi:hypothetical protein
VNLGRVVTTLLTVGVNDATILKGILPSTMDANTKTTIVDQLLREDSNQNIIELGKKGLIVCRVNLTDA